VIIMRTLNAKDASCCGTHRLVRLQAGLLPRAGPIETAMHQRMASSTQGYQVLLGIMSAVFAELHVVNL
jgi:hypothetical protein